MAPYIMTQDPGSWTPLQVCAKSIRDKGPDLPSHAQAAGGEAVKERCLFAFLP